MVKFTSRKNKNNKGFAMAELLAVCIIVLGIFTILFSNYLPLVAEFENRISYNNVTAQYAAHYIRVAYNDAFKHATYGLDIKNMIDGNIASTGYYSVYKNGDVNPPVYSHLNSAFGADSDRAKGIKELIKGYGIEEIIITPYKLENVKGKYPNTGMLYNYINYLPKYKNSPSDESYRIILKTKNYGYATTPIKYNEGYDVKYGVNVSLENKKTYNSFSESNESDVEIWSIEDTFYCAESYKRNDNIGKYKVGDDDSGFTIKEKSDVNLFAGQHICVNENPCSKMYYVEYIEDTETVIQGNSLFVNVNRIYSYNESTTKKIVAENFIFDADNKKFVLVDLEGEIYSSDSKDKYTCDSETENECTTMYRIKKVEDGKVTSADKFTVKE